LRPAHQRGKKIVFILCGRRGGCAENPGSARLRVAGGPLRRGELGVVGAVAERVHELPPCL
jgi:hypothetical protein